MWRVVDEASATTLSEHQSSSAAELAAWRHARAARVEAILLHDRYFRVHPAVDYLGTARAGRHRDRGRVMAHRR